MTKNQYLGFKLRLKLKTIKKKNGVVFLSLFIFFFFYLRGVKFYTEIVRACVTNFTKYNVDFITPNLLKKDSSKDLLREMVIYAICMILSNQLGHTENRWTDALCTPVLLDLLQGRLPRPLRPCRRSCRPKLHCSP